MDWFRATIDLLGVLAWPTVSLIVAFVFRKEFVRLVGRISKLSAAGVSAEFLKEEIEDLHKSVEESRKTSEKNRGSVKTGGTLQHSATTTGSDPQQYLNEAKLIVDSSVTGAMALGRLALEKAIDQALFFRSEGQRKPGTSGGLEELRPRLSGHLYSQSAQALQIANKAVHGVADDLTPRVARDHLETIGALLDELAQI